MWLKYLVTFYFVILEGILPKNKLGIYLIHDVFKDVAFLLHLKEAISRRFLVNGDRHCCINCPRRGDIPVGPCTVSHLWTSFVTKCWGAFWCAIYMLLCFEVSKEDIADGLFSCTDK